MDFRFALDNALTDKPAEYWKEMLSSLDIKRADVAGFLTGRCSLTYRELQQLLTYVGYKLEM